MQTAEQKIKYLYVERFNGNLCVAGGDFERAVAHYNKAVLGLKMILSIEKDPIITSTQQAIKLVKEIDIIVCTNLAHCYNKLLRHDYAIKYAKQALDQDPGNKKAMYRLGVAHTAMGQLSEAKDVLENLLSDEVSKDDEPTK